MKKIIFYLSLIFTLLIAYSCTDRDILDYKEGTSLPEVTDLSSTLSDLKNIKLNWNIPSEIPSEMERPISVYIQVYKGNVREYQIFLANEPIEWEYTLKDLNAKYRITVKLYGNLNEKSYGKSNEIYSLGKTVEVN